MTNFILSRERRKKISMTVTEIKLKNHKEQSPLVVGFVYCSEPRKSTIER
jgi:hypothetical protein